MLKRSLFLLILLVLLAPVTQADTIYLKNGSILKGKVASFSDDQFTVMLDTGSGRFQSRAMVYVGDVTRIEFDSLPGGATADLTPRDPAPRETAPHDPAPTTRPTETARDNASSGRAFDRSEEPVVNKPTKSKRTNDAPARVVVAPDIPRTNTATEPQPKSAPPVETPRDSNPADSQPPIGKEKPTETVAPDKPAETVPDKPAVINPTSTSEPTEIERPARKSGGPVRTASVDVVGKRDWTSTGLIIKRGDHVRVNASGTVTLDPTSGQSSGPEGIDTVDPKKLMPDKPSGALIGVIGADNDDFIFIGRAAEFTATRDGLLFLSVNEGTLADNSGVFKAVIEVQTQKK